MPLHPRVPTSMDLDLAVQQKNHPVLLEAEQETEEEEEDDEDSMLLYPPAVPNLKEEIPGSEVTPHEGNLTETDEDSTDTEEDDFSKSS